jgi:hypothetical protein
MIVASMGGVTARLMDAPVLRSANDRSRWCTVWSLVERNTYQIDEIRKHSGWDTIDLVRHDNHFYSSKPPLLPRLVAEIYRAIKLCTGWTLTGHTAFITRLILFLINILPMALGLWYFAKLLEEYGPHGFGLLYVMACACWGTMILPYLTVFNNHTIAANCFFLVLSPAARIIGRGDRHSWRFAACGLLAAFGVCNELPAALLGLALFVLLLLADRVRTLTWFLPAALIPLAAFFITNYQATGSWKPFYAGYGTKTYEFTYEGVPSYWSEPKGIDLPRDSTATYLFHCTLGHHGIFSLSPIYLLTLIGWGLACAPGKVPLRKLHLLGLLLTIVTLGFYLTKTENYNYGGVSVALRWMLWLTPFWLLSMLPVFVRWGESRLFRASAAVLLAVSVFSAWYPANAPWAQNWIFNWMQQAKWIDYSDPPPRFSHKHYTWIGQLPEGPLQKDYWVTLATVTAEGELEQLQLRDAGPVDDQLRAIKLIRRRGDDPEVEVTYVLDPAAFRAEQPVEEFLLRRQDGSPLTEEDLNFFRGMPRRMQYVSSRIRYVKLPLRTDAFRCHVGYTAVTGTSADGSEHHVIRDVWYTEEIPFGVLQWEDRVQMAGSRNVISRKEWRAAQAGKFLPRDKTSPF